MALVINVSYSTKSEAKSYVYKDASFSTIGNILPVYYEIDIGSDNLKLDATKGKRYYKMFQDEGNPLFGDQRYPRKVFTDTGRRYDVFPYEMIGNALYLERILTAEGISQSDIPSGIWKVQYSGIVNQQENSIYDKEAIKNSIKNIFTFSLRERIILPEFGSCLNDIIGTSITDGQSVVIREMVEKMVSWEPRINLQSVSVSQNPDNYEVSIGIIYNIPSLRIDQESLEFLVKVTDD